MPAALLPREEVVDRLMAVFRTYGYDGASLAELSKATGLGRSSLYHYFPGGKEDMARGVLDRIDAWLADTALAPLRGKGTPRKRLEAMLAALDAFYVGGSERCLLGNLVLGGSRARFQARLQGTFSTWIDALAALAVETGVSRKAARERAEDAVLQIQGALILAGGLDDPAPFRRVLRRIPDLLLAA